MDILTQSLDQGDRKSKYVLVYLYVTLVDLSRPYRAERIEQSEVVS